MKETMNNRNIARYHKLLKAKFDLDEISAALKITVATLKRFSPKIMAEVKVNKKRAADKAYGKEPQQELELDAIPEDKPKTKSKAKKSAAEATAEQG